MGGLLLKRTLYDHAEQYEEATYRAARDSEQSHNADPVERRTNGLTHNA